jgi:phosphopantothenoylcysteine decarboxylase/phosphopantothenate--cysteine ligase
MPRLLLIISGSVAAYKSLDLIRRLRERDIAVSTIVTPGAARFITPLAVSALSQGPVYQELFSLTEESEMGHIRLARDHDLIAVIPASADRLARMAAGRADDLASAVLLATDKPVIVAPAMNPVMWRHPATRRNVAQLQQDGVRFIPPEEGSMACGETGTGRLPSDSVLLDAILSALAPEKPLQGVRALVTSGPTREPIDPVRYIANRSSGKQGHAIAEALARAGAQAELVSGPVALPDPWGVQVTHVETASQMLDACMARLPADLFVACAAVSDWRASNPLTHKIKKRAGDSPPRITLATNPDILQSVAMHGILRPRLVIGFAAETENLEANARAKLSAKGCDWIVANCVAEGGIFGEDETSADLIAPDFTLSWRNVGKAALARELVLKIAERFRPPDGHGDGARGKNDVGNTG